MASKMPLTPLTYLPLSSDIFLKAPPFVIPLRTKLNPSCNSLSIKPISSSKSRASSSSYSSAATGDLEATQDAQIDEISSDSRSSSSKLVLVVGGTGGVGIVVDSFRFSSISVHVCWIFHVIF